MKKRHLPYDRRDLMWVANMLRYQWDIAAGNALKYAWLAIKEKRLGRNGTVAIKRACTRGRSLTNPVTL